MRTGPFLILLMAWGCAPVPVGFDAPSEVKRMDAVVAAAAENDTRPETIRHLIEELDSYDPAMRMLAARTLQRLTGRDFGYDYAAPEWRREQAIADWISWYHQTYGSADDIKDECAELSTDE